MSARYRARYVRIQLDKVVDTRDTATAGHSGQWICCRMQWDTKDAVRYRYRLYRQDTGNILRVNHGSFVLKFLG